MVDVGRARKLSKRIGTVVASAIEFEIKDPPAGLRDRHGHEGHGRPARRDGVLHGARRDACRTSRTTTGAAAALERAKGTLRTKVGAGTGVRFTPTLTFVLDKLPDTARDMEDLLARARQADADLARIRQGATPAGDATRTV